MPIYPFLHPLVLALLSIVWSSISYSYPRFACLTCCITSTEHNSERSHGRKSWQDYDDSLKRTRYHRIPEPHFFVFILANALPLLTLFFGLAASFPPAPARAAFLSLDRFRTRSLSTFTFTPFSARALVRFFASRRATRSGSVALTFLRSSLGRCASFAPSSGLPLGVCFVAGTSRGADADLELEGPACGLLWAEDAMEDAGERVDLNARSLGPPGRVLQRCTRSLRFANLSLDSSSARISSTHSRSYRQA